MDTKYYKGQLPIDHYKPEVDNVVKPIYHQDWESLRQLIAEYGLRNSTLSAQMPSESSSIVCNATNGIEPPRDHLSIKKSKKGTLKQIVPQFQTLKNRYTLLWDMKSMEGYLNIMAVMQKFFDQSISTNTSYNPRNFEGEEVPASVLMGDILKCYQLGIKTLYYQNTYDGKGEEDFLSLVDKNTDELLEWLGCRDELYDECETCKI